MRSEATADVHFSVNPTLFGDVHLDGELRVGRSVVVSVGRYCATVEDAIVRVQRLLFSRRWLLHRWADIYGGGVRIKIDGISDSAQDRFNAWLASDFIAKTKVYSLILERGRAHLSATSRVLVPDMASTEAKVVSLEAIRERRRVDTVPLVALWSGDEQLQYLGLILRDFGINTLRDLEAKGAPVLRKLTAEGPRAHDWVIRMQTWATANAHAGAAVILMR